MNEQTLWVSGKLRGHAAGGTPAWDLQGVFDTEDAAAAACQDGNDFIGPVPLNKPLPQTATDWPGCRYPMASMATTLQRGIRGQGVTMWFGIESRCDGPGEKDEPANAGLPQVA